MDLARVTPSCASDLDELATEKALCLDPLSFASGHTRSLQALPHANSTHTNLSTDLAHGKMLNSIQVNDSLCVYLGLFRHKQVNTSDYLSTPKQGTCKEES
jgi:hypothetical protein